MGFSSKIKIFCLFFLALSLIVASAHADHTEESGHSTLRVYRTALRYLRVNQNYPIIEKDEVSGYLLFEYPGEKGDKASRGSVEVIESEKGSRLIVRIENYPSYYEEYLAVGVLNKLKDQYGDPKPKEVKKSPAESKKKLEEEKNRDGAIKDDKVGN